jgi:tellurite resistance protein TerA
MPIDYTKRPKTPPAGQPVAGGPPPPPPPAGAPIQPPPPGTVPAGGYSDQPSSAAAPTKVRLTKSAPTVSLTKHGAANGTMRVNLNWNARKPGGFFNKVARLDLDLGCLFEFTDGSKGVVQALGNSFTAAPPGVHEPVIRLDGDDRSGSANAGENLFINLAYANQIRRILVFALIYEGAANWADAQGVVTLFPSAGPQIEVQLDDPRNGARICAIALLEGHGGDVSVRREVNYINGAQRLLDETYGWGMNWTRGRK